MIKESDVLERIAETIDSLDCDGLAKLHNNLTGYDEIAGDDIELSGKGHCLVLKEGTR